MPERAEIRAALAGRPAITLFSDPLGLYSLRVRIVLAEMAVTARVFDIEAG